MDRFWHFFVLRQLWLFAYMVTVIQSQNLGMFINSLLKEGNLIQIFHTFSMAAMVMKQNVFGTLQKSEERFRIDDFSCIAFFSLQNPWLRIAWMNSIEGNFQVVSQGPPRHLGFNNEVIYS